MGHAGPTFSRQTAGRCTRTCVRTHTDTRTHRVIFTATRLGPLLSPQTPRFPFLFLSCQAQHFCTLDRKTLLPSIKGLLALLTSLPKGHCALDSQPHLPPPCFCAPAITPCCPADFWRNLIFGFPRKLPWPIQSFTQKGYCFPYLASAFQI